MIFIAQRVNLNACIFFLSLWNNLTEGGEGNKALSKVTVEMNGVCKTKGKGILYKHLTLIDKGVSYGGTN